jgi:hypothetical protein
MAGVASYTIYLINPNVKGPYAYAYDNEWVAFLGGAEAPNPPNPTLTNQQTKPPIPTLKGTAPAPAASTWRATSTGPFTTFPPT